MPPIESAVVHPLVLLSVVDHYNRVAQNTKKRVLGVLLGHVERNVVHVSNSYAIPFEEDEKDPSIWFIDHNYHESMSELFLKVNAKERPVGWYHSGPKLRSSDMDINELFKRYTPNPVLVIIDVKPKDLGLPTDAYIAVEEIHDDGTEAVKTFAHISSAIEAEEAEEIGVEHLLRDIKDNVAGSISTSVSDQVNALKGLESQLSDVEVYLGKVVNGDLPINHAILNNLQDMFNLRPNIQSPEFIRSVSTSSNDEYFAIYLASLVRSIISLHDLINNKLTNQDAEKLKESSEANTVSAQKEVIAK